MLTWVLLILAVVFLLAFAIALNAWADQKFETQLAEFSKRHWQSRFAREGNRNVQLTVQAHKLDCSLKESRAIIASMHHAVAQAGFEFTAGEFVERRITGEFIQPFSWRTRELFLEKKQSPKKPVARHGRK